MKQFLQLFFLFLIVFANKGIASNADLFDYNEQQIEKEFIPLNQLEDLILHQTNDKLTDEAILKISNEIYLVEPKVEPDDPNYGVRMNPVLFGFCLGPLGVIYVLATSENRQYTGKVAIGCLASIVFGLMLNLALGQ